MNDESKRLTRHQKRSQKCRHFNGCQHERCEAGVAYADLMRKGDDKWHFRLPCLPWHNDGPGETAKCEKFAVFSAEEVAKQERETSEYLDRIEKVMVAVRPLLDEARKDKKPFSRLVDCAACGGKGTLFLSITSYNWHSRARCRTCGVGWIQ